MHDPNRKEMYSTMRDQTDGTTTDACSQLKKGEGFKELENLSEGIGIPLSTVRRGVNVTFKLFNLRAI